MIDVSSIINDPDFNLPFSRISVVGSYDASDNWSTQPATPENMNGIVLPSKLDELKFLPEGERLAGSISVYCLTELQMGDGQTKQADLIEFQGQWYRVAFTRYYAQCSLWYAICVRYQGDPANPQYQ